ncbi:MAG: hypothetical protein ACI81R_003850 [Bradymonadia bacterium]|jgi:hypothetical protein
MLFGAYFLFLLLFMGAVYAPGVLLASKLFPRWTAAEQAALGPMLSLPMLLIAWRLLWNVDQLLASPAMPSPFVWSAALVIGTLASGYYVFRDPRYRSGLPLLIMCGYAAHIAVTAAAQSFWQAPSFHGGDFFNHAFRIPYRFLMHGTLAGDRPVLVAMVTTAFTTGVRQTIQNQWVFQLGAVVCNGLIVCPAILLASRLTDHKATWVAAAFLVFNPFMVQQTMYVWPKLAAAASILAVLYLLFFKEDRASAAAAGAFAAIAYCCHQQAAILILPMGALWFLLPSTKDRWARALAILAIGAMGFLLYMGWSRSFGYSPGQSRQLYCPVMNYGWWEMWPPEHEAVMARLREYSAWDIIRFRMANVGATFFPMERPMRESEYFVYDNATAAAFVSVTLASLAALLTGVGQVSARARSAVGGSMLLWLLAMAGFAGCVLHGLAGWGLGAMVALMLVLGAITLTRLAERGPAWKYGILALVAVETVYWTFRWFTDIAVLVAGHKEGLNPELDDFLERQLANYAPIVAEHLVFVDDVLAGQRVLVCLVCGLSVVALVLQAWRHRGPIEQGS